MVMLRLKMVTLSIMGSRVRSGTAETPTDPVLGDFFTEIAAVGSLWAAAVAE
jgi:hypothetical protein